jgi:hypothetical protein
MAMAILHEDQQAAIGKTLWHASAVFYPARLCPSGNHGACGSKVPQNVHVAPSADACCMLPGHKGDAHYKIFF